MPKASLILVNGTKVQIEGTADEVAALLNTYSNPGTRPKRTVSQKRKRGGRPNGKPGATKPKRKGPVGLIADLAKEEFFKTKRRLPEIQKKLEEQGHIYAQTSLSSAVLSLTKRKVLRRMEEAKGWIYVRGSADI